MPLKVDIVTAERLVFSDEGVDEVVVPGIFGEFGVLPGHTTFLSGLGSGRLSYLQGGQSKSLELSGGFCEVRADRVTVLADSTS